jgi:putative spermidine/putrescine transport system ATP-binding protein/spermidine/putrescine transport system ATP-binding protein
MAETSERPPVRTDRNANGDHAVRFEGVTKRYGDVTAVDDVSFGIDEKEFLTLLGPSGAGKSTLLHMIAGFTQPTDGEIYIEGEPVSAQPPYERNIGMVFQSMALFPHKTVHGNIAFPLKMRRHDPDNIDERVAEMLDLVRLPGIEDRGIGELSGGQQQRIAIARALAFEPSLLLLDEPLSSLDKKLREEMRHEITRIHEETDVTTIHVTHNQEEALTMADRIAVINEGAVAQLADTTTLYRRPETSFVADFVGNTNMFPGEVVDDDGTIRTSDGGFELVADLSGQRAGDAVEVALRHEQIRIGEEPLGTENEYEATVVESVFRGDLIDYRVGVDGLATELEVSQLNEQTTRVFETGDTVRIGWNGDNVLVYSR